MRRISRRTFLAGSAAVAAGPAVAQTRRAPAQRQPETSRTGALDVIVIGAGAAGIAAARRLTTAGRRVAILEANASVGGRCITDTTTFGVPFDRGAHWIHTPEFNPVARLARETGLDLYQVPPGQRMRIGRRYAREGEMEDYLAGLVRANSAITDAARKTDVAAAQALPKDLGEWRPTIEFVLGPYASGKDLAEVSAADLSRSTERENDAFCRQGFGTLLGRLASPLSVRLATAVTHVEWGARNRVEVGVGRTVLEAPAAIITVSTSILTSGKIKFIPDLPRRQFDAATKLKLGSYDHVALELPGNPLGLRTDELVFEKSNGPRTGALLANIGGTTLCTVDVAGGFGRDLSAKGDAAMIAFALDWIGELYGADMKAAVRRRHATRWNAEPWVMGAASVAAPGAQAARRVLMEPLNRLWFAGEAAHETAWGTVGGAWESGERAADAVNKLIGARR